MCAYKVCKIECAFWGCQSRVEKIISESVLRTMILMSHRQAWCWQDEYADLTMDDVRKLEHETQLYLNAKMRNDIASLAELDKKFKQLASSKEDLKSLKLVSAAASKASSELTLIVKESNPSLNSKNTTASIETNSDYEDFPPTTNDDQEEKIIEKNLSKQSTNHTIHLTGKSINSDESVDFFYDDNNSYSSSLSNENPNRGGGEEFYDAISQTSMTFSYDDEDEETQSTNSLNSNSSTNSRFNKPNKASRKRRLLMFKKAKSQTSNNNNNNNNKPDASQIKIENNINHYSKVKFDLNLSQKPSHYINDNSKISSSIDLLMIVVHGGNVTCTDTSKQSDFTNFKTTLENLLKMNYSQFLNRIAYRLVACEPICKDALIKLAK
jgi:hypothetical protein